MLLTTTTGLRVVSKSSAEQIGTVKRVLIDPGSPRIVAIHVGGPKQNNVVDWDSITVGPDAVVLESEEHLREPLGDREMRAVKGDLDVVGKLILSDRGNACGRGQDVDFDPITGQLVSIVTDIGSVEGERLRAVGSYAAIVRASESASLSGL